MSVWLVSPTYWIPHFLYHIVRSTIHWYIRANNIIWFFCHIANKSTTLRNVLQRKEPQSLTTQPQVVCAFKSAASFPRLRTQHHGHKLGHTNRLNLTLRDAGYRPPPWYAGLVAAAYWTTRRLTHYNLTEKETGTDQKCMESRLGYDTSTTAFPHILICESQ